MVKVQRLFAKTNLKIPVYRTDQILFRNEGAHFQAPSGDGMRSAAFCTLPVEEGSGFSRFSLYGIIRMCR